MASSLPDYPWQVVGTDFFELDKSIVDYFSLYPEIVKMSSTTSACIIAALKNILHGMKYSKSSGVTMGLTIALKNLQPLQKLIIFSM